MHALGVQFQHLGFNYSGRAGIVHALRSLIASGTPPEQVNERTVGTAWPRTGYPTPIW
jgi:hypothetical protein